MDPNTRDHDRTEERRIDEGIGEEEAVFGGVSDHTALFGALALRSCRFVLYQFLGASESSASVDELVDGVRALAVQADERSLVGDERLETLLRERSIPRLRRLGVVEYDPRSDVVRYHRRPFVEEYVEHAAFQELPAGVPKVPSRVDPSRDRS